MNENIRFNFSMCPNLKVSYEEHYKLKMDFYKWGMKKGLTASKKMSEAEKKYNDYSENVFAKAVYDEFSAIKPLIHQIRGENKYIPWDELFGKTFEDLDSLKRKFLYNLIDGKYVYELPLEYYNY